MSDEQSAAPGGPQHAQQEQPGRRYGEQPPPDLGLRDRPHDDLDPSTTPIPPAYTQPPQPPPQSYVQQPAQQPMQQPMQQPAQQPMQLPTQQAPQPRPARTGPSVGERAGQFAQSLATPETRKLFTRSEFVLTLCAAVLLILAAAVQENFDAPQMWTLFTALVFAYVISRGIAKAGRRD